MERRSGSDRRQCPENVGMERRSGQERRQAQRETSNLFFVSSLIRKAFEEWMERHGVTDVIRLVSDRKRIRNCQWELWEELLGYSLKKMDLARDIYLKPEQRDDIFEEVEREGYACRTVHITRADGRVVDMDIIYCRHESGYYYTFVKIL
ncbi:hypothetical protein [Desulfobotulus mexicanus]|uniref:PAS domain-containing protein n=1 Tax=Desulfobotulus mexicanus TaxID=2586642 RepID=A0A5S5MCA3_9BACT|nr:hypothetical protein [Desulfobotulus mexicanus]TYT73344.1 hypothetical protein FIM25_15645 [Desulfobotulus mexicanus]